jgi:hypothetical protein
MREIVNLFSQSESRDELGIGQIRDAFSDILFPGTSTLHTRARYLLLIPWCFRAAAKQAGDADDLRARAERNERRLIVALNAAGAHDGLIGRQVLSKLKTLPSTLYWGALSTYEILVGDAEDELTRERTTREAEELVDRSPRMWDTLPVPTGFPDSADRLDLDHDEAGWVREHMIKGSRGSVLEALAIQMDPVHLSAANAWDLAQSLPGHAELLFHAQAFSLSIEAASLSYNLAVARRYEAHGFTTQPQPVDRYLDWIDDWWQDSANERAMLRSWDLAKLWSLVLEKNPRIGLASRHFVQEWLDLLNRDVRPDADEAVALVSQRERVQKRNQSRLVNEKLLRAWSGYSGTQRLSYRWGNVQRLMTDVVQGLNSASS